MKARFYMMLMLLMILSANGAFAQQEYHFDVNNDGEVNITDAILVVNYILGKTTEHGEDNAPCEPVDLGLPSGTKWASCNVGATKPEEYGGYYAYGEIEEKSKYDESTYEYFQNDSYVKIGDISGTQYDVARLKWGGKWRMPTSTECEELINNCDYKWTAINRVYGMRLTSKINGNSIFFPASNYWPYANGDQGLVRTGTESGNAFCRVLSFSSRHVSVSTGGKDHGIRVRPVTD